MFKRLSIILITAAAFASCATEEEIQREEAAIAREDAEYEARERRLDREDARLEGSRDAAEYQEYLVGYARGLGKKPSELTRQEREDARRDY